MSGELLCQRCGQNYVVWFAPNAVWNEVMRGGARGNPDEFSFLCPTCFTFLAEMRGIRPTAWEIRPEIAQRAIAQVRGTVPGAVQRYELSSFIGPCTEAEAYLVVDAIRDLGEFQKSGGGGVGLRVVDEEMSDTVGES